MSELGLDDYIVLNYSMIVSLAFALIGAGARTRLLAFAEALEEAEACAERLPAPPWTPEVVRGGKDDGVA